MHVLTPHPFLYVPQPSPFELDTMLHITHQPLAHRPMPSEEEGCRAHGVTTTTTRCRQLSSITTTAAAAAANKGWYDPKLSLIINRTFTTADRFSDLGNKLRVGENWRRLRWRMAPQGAQVGLSSWIFMTFALLLKPWVEMYSRVWDGICLMSSTWKKKDTELFIICPLYTVDSMETLSRHSVL